jgi:hypothetical protein
MLRAGVEGGAMNWTPGGGQGRIGAEATPEAEEGFRASRGYPEGPQGDDPGPRPGCLRTVTTTLLVLAALVGLLVLVGWLARLFG